MRLPRGFTLLELLVVLVILGITLGAVSFNAMPSERQVLQSDAQKVSLLLQSARDEAIVRNRPVAFEADAGGYRFLILENNAWKPLLDDDLLRERHFRLAPVTLSMMPSPIGQAGPLHIIFGREPVGTPFVLTLSSGDSEVAIRADGIGHFTVE